MKRVILIIADSMGCGYEPDADRYGDVGANTILHAAERTPGFAIPNFQKLGLGNITELAEGMFRIPQEEITGSFGRMREKSMGKDTITGHWEICGIETPTPFKTYPDGFPKEFIEKFQEAIGTQVLGNYPASGTEIIDQLGAEHEATGRPIVYTSADSVFQIAANTDVIPLERLYEICQTAREMLVGDWACGRVIARPYIMEDGKRTRTSDRHDYAVSPPEPTLLDLVSENGQTVYAVGKISDIFNGTGVTEAVHTTGNMDGVDKTLEAMEKVEQGFIFTNLVDFDSLYGHRRDPEGYGRAIMELDRRLPEIMAALKDEDILMVTADHGTDPIHAGFDHTREYVPIVIYGRSVRAGIDLGTRKTFADCGQTIADYLGTAPTSIGDSFLKDIIEE